MTCNDGLQSPSLQVIAAAMPAMTSCNDRHCSCNDLQSCNDSCNACTPRPSLIMLRPCTAARPASFSGVLALFARPPRRAPQELANWHALRAQICRPGCTPKTPDCPWDKDPHRSARPEIGLGLVTHWLRKVGEGRPPARPKTDTRHGRSSPATPDPTPLHSPGRATARSAIFGHFHSRSEQFGISQKSDIFPSSPPHLPEWFTPPGGVVGGIPGFCTGPN
jgi:hypothetical protein